MTNQTAIPANATPAVFFEKAPSTKLQAFYIFIHLLLNMSILIKSATILDSLSSFNGKKVDIFIKNGLLKIGDFGFSKTAKWYSHHRFQHYYSVFLYGLLTFNWAITTDFLQMKRYLQVAEL